MEKNGVSRYTTSFGLALALASVVNGLLVIAKEKSPAIQKGMTQLTGHHWVTHSVLIVGLFFICGWLFGQAKGGQGFQLTASRLIGTLLAGVATGAALILGFYLIRD